MTLYCAIDLHSNNNVPVVIDDQDNIVFQKRLPNSLSDVITSLAPFRDQLKAVAVESTFNWYWLVDGLQEHGFSPVLVNTSAVKQYEGIKHTNDFTDAFWLAHLMRLDILPTGYIYPPEQRAVRDLLRKRLQLVRQRVSNVLSAQNQIWRSTGQKTQATSIKKADYTILNVLDSTLVKRSITANLKVIESLNQEISSIEKTVLTYTVDSKLYKNLTTIVGVGQTLGQTIMLETGDIKRFQTVGNYSSYARCVNSSRTSNNKKKGKNNTKNGNAYLSWAFVEAAHCMIAHSKTAHRFYQKKRQQVNGALATKALAHKIARAAYFIMRDDKPFEIDRLFA